MIEESGARGSKKNMPSNNPIQDQSKLELMTIIVTSIMIFPCRIIRIYLTISQFGGRPQDEVNV